jgi:hypothetical protein
MTIKAEEITEKLEKAVKDSDSATETKEKLETTEVVDKSQKADMTDKSRKAEQKQSQSVPYDRFKEQVDKIAALEEKLEKATERDKELSVQLAKFEQDHNVLERVRKLHSDDRYKPLVEKLDKALRGIEEDVESGEKTKQEGADDAKKLFNKHREEIEHALADQKADFLYQQANSMAERMLETLGDDYDDTDKEAIAKLWNPVVDWDSIEEDPSVMRDELLKSLKTVVEEYGEPRGALKSKVKEFETKKETQQETKAVPDPNEVLKDLVNRDWGKTKVDDKGKFLGPEHSDEEFSKVLAKVMRQRI